jgi:TRAP-type C4-dicarboxylate transport system permease small subunit
LYRTFDTIAGGLARLIALAGGLVLVALVVMTCLSIIGRALIPVGLSPVKGDFEWIEMGVAFAVFAFLPWCQYNRGHARVDIFAPQLGHVGNRLANVMSDVLMFGAAAVICWRLWLGMLEKKSFGETTFILQYPIWFAYAACVVGASAFVAVSAFCVLRSLRAFSAGPDDQH